MLSKTNNPVYIVDGRAEFKIVQKLYPNTPVRCLGINGCSVEIPAIAKKISSLIKAFSNRNYPFIIVIDREDRAKSCSNICAELEKEIRNLNISDKFIIGIADRMLENWILADWDNFIKYIKSSPKKPASIEGQHGKNIIKRYIKNYHEPTHGVDLFVSASAQKIASNSQSFKALHKQLIVTVNCSWLNK